MPLQCLALAKRSWRQQSSKVAALTKERYDSGSLVQGGLLEVLTKRAVTGRSLDLCAEQDDLWQNDHFVLRFSIVLGILYCFWE